MAEKDGLTELAKLFKERDAKTGPSITTGIVEALPPEPVIRLTPQIALDKTVLIFASTLLSAALEIGDEVIIIPVADGQMYYAIDKAVRFE